MGHLGIISDTQTSKINFHYLLYLPVLSDLKIVSKDSNSGEPLDGGMQEQRGVPRKKKKQCQVDASVFFLCRLIESWDEELLE